MGYRRHSQRPWDTVQHKTLILQHSEPLDQGVTFYDTAALYGWTGENLLGKAFRNRRDDVVIATAGFIDFEGKQDFTVKGVRKSLEESLTRLQTDYADLFQLHSPSIDSLESDDSLYDFWRPFKLKENTRCRHCGPLSRRRSTSHGPLSL